MNEPTIIRPIFAEKYGPNLYQVAFKYPVHHINWVVVRRTEHIYSTMEMVNRQTAEQMQAILNDGGWCNGDFDVTERGEHAVKVYDNKAFPAVVLDALLDQTDELSEHTVLEGVPEGLSKALWEEGYSLVHFRKWEQGYQIGLIGHENPTTPTGLYISKDKFTYNWVGAKVARLTEVGENSTCGKEFIGAVKCNVGSTFSIINPFLSFDSATVQTPDDQENPAEDLWKPVLQDGWQVLNIPELESLNHNEIEYFEDTDDHVIVAVGKKDPMVVRLNKKTNNAYYMGSGGSLEERVKLIKTHVGAAANGRNSKPIANALRRYASQYSPGQNTPTLEDIVLDETEKKLVLAYRQVKNKLVLYNNLKEQARECLEEAAEHSKFIDDLIADLLK